MGAAATKRVKRTPKHERLRGFPSCMIGSLAEQVCVTGATVRTNSHGNLAGLDVQQTNYHTHECKCVLLRTKCTIVVTASLCPA